MEKQHNDVEKKMSLVSKIESSPLDTPVVDKDCMLHQALLLLADKWTLPIILSLMQGPKRTSSLLKDIDPVSPKMLVQTLKKLEDADLIERKVYPVVPPRVEYALTETGLGLNEVLSKLFEWSAKRSPKTHSKVPTSQSS
jgi:DNA-binding HxlR family transcriptional regulator